jgi:hypothetical protein
MTLLGMMIAPRTFVLLKPHMDIQLVRGVHHDNPEWALCAGGDLSAYGGQYDKVKDAIGMGTRDASDINDFMAICNMEPMTHGHGSDPLVQQKFSYRSSWPLHANVESRHIDATRPRNQNIQKERFRSVDIIQRHPHTETDKTFIRY